MKELTIEEKSKRYDEVVAMAKECITYVPDEAVNKYMLNMFPELKETEDERIRKWLIAQLEIKSDVNNSRELELMILKSIAWLEKQGEQKPVDKVEPKFKDGQWIVWKDKCYKVNYNGCGYELVDQNGLSTSLEYGTIDENAHLWDISKDAKDGDVLYSPFHNLIWIYKDSEHYYVCVNLNYTTQNIAINGLIGIPKDVFPATKDEQTILFEKIKEDGCEWNAEKKELNKVIIYESKVRE